MKHLYGHTNHDKRRAYAWAISDIESSNEFEQMAKRLAELKSAVRKATELVEMCNKYDTIPASTVAATVTASNAMSAAYESEKALFAESTGLSVRDVDIMQGDEPFIPSHA